MNNVNTRGMADQQSGSVLIIGLILLLVMSISGVYMMNSSIMDERMTANQRSQTNVFLAAEAGLLAAQKELDSNWNATCVKDELIVESTFDTGVGNDTKYTVVFKEDCGASGVLLESTGVVIDPDTGIDIDTGVLRVLTARYQPMPLAGGPGDAPAAISCLGGPCKITPGQGQSSIDGRDYTLPDWSANTNAYKPKDNRLTGNIMPSLYLSDPGKSSVGSGGGQFKFCGAERKQCSNNNNSSLFYTESNYPTVDGKPTHPTAGQFFGDGTPMGDLAPTSNDVGTRDKPTVSLNPTLKGNDSGAGIMIIEGNVTMGGNTRFEGLIVIRGCGTLTMQGTPTIYGAIMVNASECDDDYSPFGQGGTPTVAYSLDALNNAGSLLPSSSGALSDWQEDINEG